MASSTGSLCEWVNAADGVDSENIPQVRADVVKETDKGEEELPAQGNY